jgi:5-methylcytosine-specific restriction endonuclease McrA
MRPMDVLSWIADRFARKPGLPTRRCPRCSRSLPLEKFSKSRTTADGYQSWCRDCHSAYHRERYNALRDQEQARVLRYQQAHPEKHREQVRLRKARRRSVTPEPYDRAEVLASNGGRCYVCGLAVELEVGHVVPIALGGPDTRDNVVPICSVCNHIAGTNVLSPTAIASIKARALELRSLEQKQAA